MEVTALTSAIQHYVEIQRASNSFRLQKKTHLI